VNAIASAASVNVVTTERQNDSKAQGADLTDLTDNCRIRPRVGQYAPIKSWLHAKHQRVLAVERAGIGERSLTEHGEDPAFIREIRQISSPCFTSPGASPVNFEDAFSTFR
jgi:hypothetical protein